MKTCGLRSSVRRTLKKHYILRVWGFRDCFVFCCIFLITFSELFSFVPSHMQDILSVHWQLFTLLKENRVLCGSCQIILWLASYTLWSFTFVFITISYFLLEFWSFAVSRPYLLSHTISDYFAITWFLLKINWDQEVLLINQFLSENWHTVVAGVSEMAATMGLFWLYYFSFTCKFRYYNTSSQKVILVLVSNS